MVRRCKPSYCGICMHNITMRTDIIFELGIVLAWLCLDGNDVDCKPLIKGKSCQGHRNGVTNHHYYTLDKGGCQVINNYDLERGREWVEALGAGSWHVEVQSDLFRPRSGVQQGRAGSPSSSSSVIAIRAVYREVWSKKGRFLSKKMGGDPVTTEPSVLKVEQDVRGILEGAGLLSFLCKFTGFNEEISHQIVDSWSDGKVTINGIEFLINEVLIAEVFGFAKEGEVITRDKTNQVLLESPHPNHGIGNKEKVNIPLFLLKSLKKLVKLVKAGKGKAPLHQGILNLLFDFEKEKRSAAAGPSRGGFSRLSKTPVSKAQLLMEPAPGSPALKSSETILDSEEDSASQEDDIPLVGTREGGGWKRKPPPQTLNSSVAKCSRRSTRLQKKFAERAKIVDFVDSSEEDHTISKVGKNVEGGGSFKMMGIDPSEKGTVKGSDGTQTLIEELRCHLKVLNGLGGSLSNTCACINLLTLEITNYLKEVVNNLKNLSAAKEQQKPAGKDEEN
eukprot:Gb_26367 [translate_table: standard]